METKSKSTIHAACHLFAGVVYAGAALMMTASALAQNLFEGDCNSGIVYQFTPGGVRSTFASGLGTAVGLAFNSEGDLFVSLGNYSGSIIKITPGGVQSTFASGFDDPEGLAFNSGGDLFVANTGGNDIIEITPDGVKSTFASGLDNPSGLAFNSAGDLFEADQWSGNIYKFTPGGMRSTFASGLAGPWGLAFNSAGNLFVANGAGNNIIEITPGGVQSIFATGFSYPNGLVFNSEGDLFVTDGLANNIIEITPDGVKSIFASGLDNPVGLAFHFQTATANADVVDGFVVAATINNGGYGYTNTPLVRFIGGGGSGAGAYAVVSNGVVTSITVTNAGYGYTNAPLVVIEPPFIPNPVLSIAPMSFLSFSNLTLAAHYQMQQFAGWYWTNQPISFTATNGLYTQMVAGAWDSGDFRLALNPIPSQAFATAQMANGFVVGATVTSGGSGYVTSPAVTIVGRSQIPAGAFSSIAGGVVTSITVTNAGYGYTNAPTIQIAPPPAAAVFPAVQPVMRVDSASLAPYDNYQIQFMPTITGTWVNWNGGLFTPTGVTNSQFLFITNGTGFFRLQYEP